MSASRSPLYRLTAFGFSPWNCWALARGGLDETCAACGGRGFLVLSPCWAREALPVSCAIETGCERCRRPCPARCRRGLAASDVVREEDFGDAASLAVARDLIPDLLVNPLPRMDDRPRAL